MKKLLLLITLTLACLSVNATSYSVTYNLTGCEVQGTAPSSISDTDEELIVNLVPLDGFTAAGATVSVTMGGATVSTDYMENDDFFMFYEGKVYIYSTYGFSGDVVITAEYKSQANINLPETFTAATFEDVTIGSTNSVYRPATFAVGENWTVSGAVAFNTLVEDWTMWGLGYGYSGTQIVNYAKDAVISDASDAFLPMAASAVAQGENYATVNIMSLFERLKLTKTTLSGFAITNTKVVVDAILNGDGLSTNEGEAKGAPFAQGDYFKLTIKGLDGESVTGSVDFYLADFRTAGQWKYAENWQWVDLSSLGEIDGLQFELESSKGNSYGMTTPAYFCIDNIGGNMADCTLGAMTVATPTGIRNVNNTSYSKVIKRIVNGQLIIERDGNTYNINGVKL